jgi:hypothetical protein
VSPGELKKEIEAQQALLIEVAVGNTRIDL